MNAVKITDPTSKIKRKVKDLKVTSHKEYDEEGKKQVNQYVEFTVIGKNRKWQNFMPLDDFKKLNPNIKI